MRVAITGTPGTGKTTAADRLDTDRPVIHLNDIIERDGLIEGRDEERDTAIVDVAAVENWLANNASEDAVIESHIAHRFQVGRVVVLRAHPKTIEHRLRERGESGATVEENAESEALDGVLAEAVEHHGKDRVYEVDTTTRTPEEVASRIHAVLRGEREPSAGTVSFTDYL